MNERTMPQRIEAVCAVLGLEDPALMPLQPPLRTCPNCGAGLTVAGAAAAAAAEAEPQPYAYCERCMALGKCCGICRTAKQEPPQPPPRTRAEVDAEIAGYVRGANSLGDANEVRSQLYGEKLAALCREPTRPTPAESPAIAAAERQDEVKRELGQERAAYSEALHDKETEEK